MAKQVSQWCGWFVNLARQCVWFVRHRAAWVEHSSCRGPIQQHQQQDRDAYWLRCTCCSTPLEQHFLAPTVLTCPVTVTLRLSLSLSLSRTPLSVSPSCRKLLLTNAWDASRSCACLLITKQLTGQSVVVVTYQTVNRLTCREKITHRWMHHIY